MWLWSYYGNMVSPIFSNRQETDVVATLWISLHQFLRQQWLGRRQLPRTQAPRSIRIWWRADRALWPQRGRCWTAREYMICIYLHWFTLVYIYTYICWKHWFILIYIGSNWYIMISFDLFWFTLIYVGIYILIYIDLNWFTLIYIDIYMYLFWYIYILVSIGLHRITLVDTDVYWFCEGSLEVKFPTMWTGEKAEVGRIREEKRREETRRDETRREEKRRDEKKKEDQRRERVWRKKMQVREKVEKSWFT